MKTAVLVVGVLLMAVAVRAGVDLAEPFEDISFSPMVFAHRGCCAYGKPALYPENTMPAFEFAMKAGVRAIETDLRRTKDGLIVIMHDDTLDRTTSCKGKVSSMTLADIQAKCDAGAWLGEQFKGTKVPSFEDVLELSKEFNTTVILDMKEAGLAADVRALVEKHGVDLSSMVVAVNFKSDYADIVKHLGSSVIADSTDHSGPAPVSPEFFQMALERRTDVIMYNFIHTTQEFVHQSHRRGIAVWTWTVDKPKDIQAAIRGSHDAVLSNDPETLMKEVREARKKCGFDKAENVWAGLRR